MIVRAGMDTRISARKEASRPPLDQLIGPFLDSRLEALAIGIIPGLALAGAFWLAIASL